MNEQIKPFNFEARLAALPIQYPNYNASLEEYNKSRLIEYAEKYPVGALQIFYKGFKFVRNLDFNDSGSLISEGYAEEMPSCIGISMIDAQGEISLSHTGPYQDPTEHIEEMLHHFQLSSSISSIVIGTNEAQMKKTEERLRSIKKISSLQMHMITDVREEGIIDLGVNPASRSIIIARHNYSSYELKY